MPIQLSGSGSITGVSTLTSLASLDVTGSVSVGGTLVYDDVTNIDSLGIVTARSDVHVGAGLSVTGISTFNDYLDINGDINIDGSQITYTSSSNQLKFADGAQLRFGDGNDLRIHHSSGASFIQDAGSGSLFVETDGGGIRLRKIAGSENLANFYVDGAVELYYNNSKKFETTNTGAVLTGILTATSFSGSGASLDDVLTSTSLQHSIEYPTIRPTLDLNFAATKTLDRRITFTRDSLGTYTDDMGIIKYASNNVPRFDHDPYTGESLGLLIEESRTNIQPNSNAPYSSGGSALVWTTGLTAPDGTTTAVKLAATAVDTYHNISAAIYPSPFASTTYTYSMYAKRDGLNRFSLKGPNLTSVTFDLSTGTVVTGAGGTITPAGNGWYRCSITESTSNNFYQYNITLNADNEAGYDQFLGDGTSGIIVWGFQMEAGAFPTSYIPTSGSTVTRAADLVKITGTNFTDFYNQSEGTFFIDSAVARGSDYQAYVGSTTNSTANSGPSYNFNSLMSDGDNSDILLNIWDGTGGAQAFISIAHPTGNMKAAGAFKDNDFAISMNGSAVSTDTSGTIDTNQDQLWIGRRPYSNAGWLNNSIKRVVYYNKRLPNAQLQGLTQQ